MPSAAVMHRSDRRHSYQFGAARQHQSPGTTREDEVFQSRARVRWLMAMTTAAIALALGMDIVTAQQPAPGSSAGSGQSSAPVQGQGPGRGRGGFTQPEPVDFQAHEGWTSLFDGKTLDG